MLLKDSASNNNWATCERRAPGGSKRTPAEPSQARGEERRGRESAKLMKRTGAGCSAPSSLSSSFPSARFCAPFARASSAGPDQVHRWAGGPLMRQPVSRRAPCHRHSRPASQVARESPTLAPLGPQLAPLSQVHCARYAILARPRARSISPSRPALRSQLHSNELGVRAPESGETARFKLAAREMLARPIVRLLRAPISSWAESAGATLALARWGSRVSAL